MKDLIYTIIKLIIIAALLAVAFIFFQEKPAVNAINFDLIKRDSRRYAKRQFTWFKKYKDAKWLDVESQDIEKLTEQILNDYNKS